MKVPEFFPGNSSTKSLKHSRRRDFYEDMAAKAENSWIVLGHSNVRFWVETDANSKGTLHAVRSNLVNGLPPKVSA